MEPTKCSLRFGILYSTKKIAKIFSSLERLPFFQKICVFNNLLSPKESMLLLPQYFSENLLDPCKTFPVVGHTR